VDQLSTLPRTALIALSTSSGSDIGSMWCDASLRETDGQMIARGWQADCGKVG